mmetsp:Transcript_63003/g.140306  ORF Transcript_63003/g.140306 Transcript_63003/m.140306 type:complete len:96 (+) Transcript_63003:220-507(+)
MVLQLSAPTKGMGMHCQLPSDALRHKDNTRHGWHQLWHDMHVLHVCAEQRPKTLPVQQHMGSSCPAFPTRFCCHPGDCRWMIWMVSVQVTAVRET